MCRKIPVVMHKKTFKIVPYEIKDNGELIILASGTYNEDDLIVTMVDTRAIDWENGYVDYTLLKGLVMSSG